MFNLKMDTNLTTNFTAFQQTQLSTFLKTFDFPILVAFLKSFAVKPLKQKKYIFFGIPILRNPNNIKAPFLEKN